jgi:hypothetical protein
MEDGEQNPCEQFNTYMTDNPVLPSFLSFSPHHQHPKPMKGSSPA